MNTKITLLTAMLLAAAAMVVEAGHHCGRCNGCGGYKYCKLVPEVTKTTTYKYYLECEDFCIPGRSKCIGTTCKPDCNGCCKTEKVMQPTCGCVRTKAKVMKVPVVKEKHGWKCVVVHVCGGCRHCAEARPATDAELQLALKTAEQQGIVLTSVSEPIDVTIPDDETQAPAVPQLLAVPESATPVEAPQSPPSLRTLGSFFSK